MMKKFSFRIIVNILKLIKKSLLLALLMVFCAINLEAAFIDIGAGITAVSNGSLAWGDYDNDGDLDLAVCGSGTSKVYENNVGTFTDISGGSLTGVARGSLAWGDYDNDGDLDLAICGSGISRIYKNDDGAFTDISGGSLTGVEYGSLAWGDYDNDGDLDLAICGEASYSNYISRIYKNDNGTFILTGSLRGVAYGSLAWGDYDNDGDLDLALCGHTPTLGHISKIYRNNDGAFHQISAGIVEVFRSSLAWGDYDNDGDLDLAICGDSYGNYISRMYKNDDGAFTDISGGSLTGVAYGSLAWGDYDNDGDLDLAICGDTGSGYISKIYGNDSGTFTDISGGSLTGVVRGSLAWGDYDNDGDLDLAICGNGISKIYRNNTSVLNYSPGPPPLLSAVYNWDNSQFEFRWNAATDTETDQNGLQYEIRVATNTIDDNLDKWIVSPSTGKGCTPFLGNYPHSFVSSSPLQLGVNIKLSSPEHGTTYYYQIRTIDTGFGKSNWTSTDFVAIDMITPSDVWNLSAQTGDIEGEIDLSWSAPGDDGWTGSLVAGSSFVVQRSTWPRDPWDYNSTTDTVRISTHGVSPLTTVNYTLTGLDPGVTYYMRIWHVDELQNWSNKSNGAIIWAQVDVSPPAVVTNLTALTGTGMREIDLSWTVPGDDGWNNVLSTGSVFRIHHSTDEVVGSTTTAQIEISTDSVVPGTTVYYTVTNLLAGATHYFKIWHADEVKNWSEISNTATVQAVADTIEPSAVTDIIAQIGKDEGEIDLNWSAPGDDGTVEPLWPNSMFRIQYSTWVIVFSKDATENIVDVSTHGIIPGMNVEYTLTGLISDATHYIRIWHKDGAGLWSNMSNGATVQALKMFTEIPAELPGVDNSCSAWGDYDNDGDIDLVICGTSGAVKISNIYNNSGNGIFTDIGAGLTGVEKGCLSWGDYDNDGDLDLAICGSSDSGKISQILNNSGNGVFSDIEAGIPGVDEGALAWGDYDNDGDLDLAICGITAASQVITRIYKNNNGTFTYIDANFTAVSKASLSWGDYDNDGDLDLAISGYTAGLETFTRIYNNDGGTFNDIDAGLYHVYGGPTLWGDYDNDGDLDLLSCGYNGTQYSRIYCNNGGGSFSDIGAGLLGINGSGTWGDYDNDGDLDIAICGYRDGVGAVTRIYRNDNGTFTESDMGIMAVYNGSLVWGDYDNDGDLDIVICGNSGSGTAAKMYRNNIPVSNSNPSPPSALNAQYNDVQNKLEFKWNAASDSETPPNGLQYEIRVATNTIDDNLDKWIVSPSTGKGCTPFMGNYPHSFISNSPLQLGLSINESALISYTTYYWQVRTIDTGFNKSGWTAEEFIYMGDFIPPSAISNLAAVTGSVEGKIALSWNMPGDDGWSGTLVAGSSFVVQRSTWPRDTWDYNSTTDTVRISTSGVTPLTTVYYILTGLDAGVTYYIRIWYCDEVPNWPNESNGATVWAQVDISSPAAVTDLTANTGISHKEIDLSWSIPGDDGWTNALVEGSSFVVQRSTWPRDVWDYNSTTDTVRISTHGVTVSTTVYYILTGLDPDVTYYMRIWHVDEAQNWSEISIGATAYARNDTEAPGNITNLLAQTGSIEGEIDLSWSAPGDDGWSGILPQEAKFAVQRSTWARDVWDYNSTTDTVRISTHGVTPSTTVNYTLTGLEPDVTYYMRIWHVDEVPLWSGVSTGATIWAQVDVTAPAYVTDISAQPGAVEGELDLTWVAPGDDEWTKILSTGSFAIQVSTWDPVVWSTSSVDTVVTSTSGVVPLTNISQTLTGLDPGATHYIRIWYADERENWSWRSTKVFAPAQTDVTGPGKVTDLSSDVGSNHGEIDLSWSMSGDDEWIKTLSAGSKFAIQRSTWENWQEIIWSTGSTDTIIMSTSGVTPSTTVYYTLTGLDPGVTYYLRIWHSDESMNWSDESNGTTTWAKFDSIQPASVTDLTAQTGATEGKIDLSWSMPGDDDWNITLSTGSQFAVQRSTWENWQEIVWSTYSVDTIVLSTSGVTPSTTVNYTLTGLDAGVTYYMRIWHCDEAPNWSDESSGATTWAQIDVTPPATTTDLVAQTGYLRREIDLFWSSPGDDDWNNALSSGSIFRIQHSTWAGVVWSTSSVINMIEISTSNIMPGIPVKFTITGLIADTTNYARIWYADELKNWSEISVGATAWVHDEVLFNEDTSINIAGTSLGDLEWVDYDSDGDLDLVVCGQTEIGSDPSNPARITKIYRNNGAGTFTDMGALGIDDVFVSSMDWGDYDNDGDLDIVICGNHGYPVVAVTKIFKNTNNVFSAISAGLSGAYSGDVKWGDYDNDGDLDLAVCGITATKIYRNDSSDTFVDIGETIFGGTTGRIDWGDYDSDGDLDLVVCGNFVSEIYRNDNGDFVNISAPLMGVSNGFVSWADYDNDGDLDLAMCGSENYFPVVKIARIYRNQGGTYGEYDFIPFTGVDQGSLSWGDFDNDGDLDIAFFGATVLQEILFRIYKHDINNDTFEVKSTSFTDVTTCKMTWGDYDNDTDLDLAYCGGISTSTMITKVYRNDGADVNVKPSPPQNFTAEYSTVSERIELRWDAGTDEQTSSNGLYYEIGIATLPYNDNPSFWLVSMSPGMRTSPFFGKYSPSVVSSSPLQLGVNINKSSLASQNTYYSNVRSIDTGFAKSSLATTSFYVPDVHPPGAITGLTGFPGNNRSEAILKWNIPGDDGESEVLKTGSEFSVQYSTWYAVQRSTWIDVFYSTYSTVQATGTISFSWSTASAQVEVSTQGIAPLTYVSYAITGLNAGSTYFFKIWHVDEVQNWSDISNTATTWAQIDHIVPGKVTDLFASVGPHPREIHLSWSATGRDGYDDPLPSGSQFRIQYSTWESGFSWSYDNAQIIVSTFGVATGTLVSYMHNISDSDTTYYLKIWHADEFLNWSQISNTATAQTLTDNSSPAQVTVLAMPGSLGGEIDLSWQAPGDDEWYVPLSSGSQFIIQHSTCDVTWSTSSAQVKVSTDGVIPLTTVYYTITGLDISTTYYLKLWHVDAQSNYSIESDSVSERVDITVPGNITDLEAFVGYQEGDVKLRWSAPGNDGSENVLNEGSKFVIHYSSDDAVQWSTSSIQLSISTSGATPASQVAYIVTGLSANDTYYFRVWHYDEFQNLSQISNGATTYAHTSILFQDIGAGLTGFANSELAWGDYDNDNDLDLLVSGSLSTNTINTNCV